MNECPKCGSPLHAKSPDPVTDGFWFWECSSEGDHAPPGFYQAKDCIIRCLRNQVAQLTAELERVTAERDKLRGVRSRCVDAAARTSQRTTPYMGGMHAAFMNAIQFFGDTPQEPDDGKE